MPFLSLLKPPAWVSQNPWEINVFLFLHALTCQWIKKPRQPIDLPFGHANCVRREQSLYLRVRVWWISGIFWANLVATSDAKYPLIHQTSIHLFKLWARAIHIHKMAVLIWHFDALSSPSWSSDADAFPWSLISSGVQPVHLKSQGSNWCSVRVEYLHCTEHDHFSQNDSARCNTKIYFIFSPIGETELLWDNFSSPWFYQSME